MLEIVHDIAPGAALAFHTAEGGQANFARGILALHAAGAKVIVDDVIYLAEPMFQDGIVAQAVDQVAARGTAYFSAAGNDGRQSYERRFRNSRKAFDYGFGPAPSHDFDPGPGVDLGQRITVPELGCGLFVLQWTQPFRSVSGAPGSATDFALLLLNPEHTIAYAASLDQNRRSDPVETGNDEVHGRGGDDLLCGGAGKDSVFGEGGRDRLFGGAGNDRLDGGKGKNRLIGGSGRDTCVRRREETTCR